MSDLVPRDPLAPPRPVDPVGERRAGRTPDRPPERPAERPSERAAERVADQPRSPAARRLREAPPELGRLLGEVLDATPVLLVVLDAHGEVRWVNAEVERLTGWRPEELAGRQPLRRLLPDETSLRRAWATLRRGRETWTEVVVRARSGRRLPVAWRGAALPDGGLVLVGQDASERRAMSATLAAHERRARDAQKLEAIGRFAGGIAHDFNNLLTAIRGGAQLVAESLPPDALEQTDVRDIDAAARRAAGLVRQLLAFSRRQTLAAVAVDVNHVVREMEHLLRRIMGSDVEIATVLEESLPPVLGEPGQLEQVLMNLAVNARDAMPAGGALVISTERVDGPVDLPPGAAGAAGAAGGPAALAADGRWVRLVVADTGCGIPDDVRPRIFEPFFTTKGEGRGTGLGLATVAGIVTQAGGGIGVESIPGRGTRFTMHLPAAARVVEPEAAAVAIDTWSPAPRARAAAHPPGTGVLLVEDDDAVRAIAARVLRGAGYVVHEARGISDAIDRWRQGASTIAALVSDVHLPGGDGPTLAAYLRDDRPALPVLLTSGDADPAAATLAPVADGPVRFLEKPFTPERLLDAVRALVAGEGEGA